MVNVLAPVGSRITGCQQPHLREQAGIPLTITVARTGEQRRLTRDPNQPFFHLIERAVIPRYDHRGAPRQDNRRQQREDDFAFAGARWPLHQRQRPIQSRDGGGVLTIGQRTQPNGRQLGRSSAFCGIPRPIRRAKKRPERRLPQSLIRPLAYRFKITLRTLREAGTRGQKQPGNVPNPLPLHSELSQQLSWLQSSAAERGDGVGKAEDDLGEAGLLPLREQSLDERILLPSLQTAKRRIQPARVQRRFRRGDLDDERCAVEGVCSWDQQRGYEARASRLVEQADRVPKAAFTSGATDQRFP